MPFKPGEINGKPWKKGHHSTHDLRAAGLKGKAHSPWRHNTARTPGAKKLREQWEREGTLRR